MSHSPNSTSDPTVTHIGHDDGSPQRQGSGRMQAPAYTDVERLRSAAISFALVAGMTTALIVALWVVFLPMWQLLWKVASIPDAIQSGISAAITGGVQMASDFWASTATSTTGIICGFAPLSHALCSTKKRQAPARDGSLRSATLASTHDMVEHWESLHGIDIGTDLAQMSVMPYLSRSFVKHLTLRYSANDFFIDLSGSPWRWDLEKWKKLTDATGEKWDSVKTAKEEGTSRTKATIQNVVYQVGCDAILRRKTIDSHMAFYAVQLHLSRA